MTVVTLPYDFVGGTRAVADQVDANFNALVSAFATSVQTTLQTATTFYVAPTGADIAGNGLSPATPAATMTFILNMLHTSYNTNNQTVTIQLANGTYTESVFNLGPIQGQASASQLTIQGNMTSPNLVIWNGNPCIAFGDGSFGLVQGMTLQSSPGASTTYGYCLQAGATGRCIFQNVIFGVAAAYHIIAARGGEISAIGNYTISGGAAVHAVATENGQVYIDGGLNNLAIGTPTVTLTGTPAFSNAFVSAQNLANMRIAAVFNGAATGVRYNAGGNSLISVLGQGLTYLPGSVAGTTSNGGQYF